MVASLPLYASIRVGQGFDSHRLVAGRPLKLGGVTIPSPRGLAGHSDADALLHAITDALFGAAGLGNIGQHFPDTDPLYHDADSRLLLKQAYKKVQEAGYGLINLDATVIAQAPKLAPYLAAMCGNVATDLGVATTTVNIKAKTNEAMGFIGRGEGIAVLTTLLLGLAQG